MRLLFLIAAPLLLPTTMTWCGTADLVVVAAEENNDAGLFFSKVDRTQDHLAPELSENPFDLPRIGYHSKAAKVQEYAIGKSKSAKIATYVGAIHFGGGSGSKSETADHTTTPTTATTTTASVSTMVSTLNPTSKPTLPHDIIKSGPNYDYHYRMGSKSVKSGKSGSKSGKTQGAYYVVRPLPPPPPTLPPKTTTTTTATTTSSSTTTAASAVSSTTTTFEVTTSTTSAASAAASTTTTFEVTTQSATDFFDNSTDVFDNSTDVFDNSTDVFDNSTDVFDNSTDVFDNSTDVFDNSTDVFDNSTLGEEKNSTATPVESERQCFVERSEILSAVERYTQGGCGAEEAREYDMCKDDVATYGWPIGSWCIGNVTNLSHLFSGQDTFNEDISDWDVEKVTDMWGMFIGAKSFNQDLSNWDVSSVTDMNMMFAGATSFNQNLCAWGDIFPYENASDIFSNTLCTYQVTPMLENRGPFCASTCGEEIAATVTTSVPAVTSVATATTTTSIEAESTEVPSASPSSQLPTVILDIVTSTSTAVPGTTTSIATTSVITTVDANTAEEATTTTEATAALSTTAADVKASTASDSIAMGTSATTQGDTETSPLQVTLTYDISNQCGVDADKVMNEIDNNLKAGLIVATTTVLQQTLNEGTTRSNVDRPLSGFRVFIVPRRNQIPEGRALAQYSEEYPITIDRIIDVEQNCEPGSNCLLIVSSIYVLLEEGDDPDEVKNAVTNSILDSFKDGRFNDAIPTDTVVCPMEDMSEMIITARVP